MKRNSKGQFEQSFDDDKAISVLVSAERPLSTSEVAERMGVPRTTAHDGLRRIQDDYPIKTWLMDGSTRCWDVEGDWGDRSFVGVYPDDALRHYFETGKFPSDVSHSDVVGLIDEMQLESVYRSPLFSNWRYEEVSMLADLFDMGPFEFATLTQNEIYGLMHDGEMEVPIEESNEDEPEPNDDIDIQPLSRREFRSKRKNAGIAQQRIAERTDTTQPRISGWENGNTELKRTDAGSLTQALYEILKESK